MRVSKQTKRSPNFSKDAKYGEIVGENDFKKMFEKNWRKLGYNIFNVTKIDEYQKCSIDFIVDKLGGDKLPPINIVLKNKKRYRKVEAKTDGVAIKSGNLPYEVISHAKPGWCIKTKCDYVYFTLTERDSENIVKRVWLDMKGWRDFVNSGKYEMESNFINSEKGIADLLCKISDLEKAGVILKIK